MRKFYIKSTILFLFAFFYISSKFVPAYYYDTFNVFHWNNIRFTSAEPNKNFVKTKYILKNPKKFNAFIFGSSRVGFIPPNFLPKHFNGKELSWYNMTCSEGIPAEQFLMLKTLLKNGIDVEMALLAFDNISMYASLEIHKAQLLRIPYQVYEENILNFYIPYLKTQVDPSIIKQINEYKHEDKESEKEVFYSYGAYPKTFDFSLEENKNKDVYDIYHFGYTQKESHKDIEAIVDLCAQNNIKLVLCTNPLYKKLFYNSADDGYFDFLRSVAQKCEFYNFSTLNNYTMDPRYYFEWSHYRPALALITTKYLFGTEEEREQIRQEAGDELFGAIVNSQNIDEVIKGLEKQLKDFPESPNP